jgi:hypothetical protein
MGPAPGDSLSPPAQQDLGAHDSAVASSARKSRCDRSQRSPVVVIDSWPVHLSAQDREPAWRELAWKVLQNHQPFGIRDLANNPIGPATARTIWTELPRAR